MTCWYFYEPLHNKNLCNSKINLKITNIFFHWICQWLKTNDQKLSTKCQLKFLLLFLFEKKRGQPGLFSFWKETTKHLGLVIGFWSSNEKDNFKCSYLDNSLIILFLDKVMNIDGANRVGGIVESHSDRMLMQHLKNFWTQLRISYDHIVKT